MVPEDSSTGRSSIGDGCGAKGIGNDYAACQQWFRVPRENDLCEEGKKGICIICDIWRKSKVLTIIDSEKEGAQ